MKDEQLQSYLETATQEAAQKAQGVRAAIQSGLQPRARRLYPRAAAWAAAALLTCLCFFALTEPGRALATSVWRLFAPEKQVEIPLEGLNDTDTALLAPDEGERYAFYYDAARFERVTKDGADMLRVRDQAADLPAIQMEIRRLDQQTAAAQYQQTLSRTPKAFDLGAVDSPIKGYGIEIWQGEGWNAPVQVIYWMDDGSGNAYEFRLSAFAEAYEGYIQRMKQILSTFEIVK